MLETLIADYSAPLSEFLTAAEIRKLLQRIERIACKIAPINTETGNTETVFRWELPAESPHFATESECEEICAALIGDLLGLLGATGYTTRDVLDYFNGRDFTPELVREMVRVSTRIGSLELPIEYRTPLNAGGRHAVTNLFWFKPHAAIDQLRVWVDNDNVVTKIQVKAYLTDRRQTGDFQTNREMRWETDPRSPQFATRIDCINIELKLLAQIATFTDAPAITGGLAGQLDTALGSSFAANSFRCPISGKPIRFNEFIERVSAPVHGRSGYQVGHLNPLATQGGHTATNTSWITDLGNRVQGDASIDAIVKDIFYMAKFHKERLELGWEEVEEIARQE